jgi:hypothetical protein
MYKFFTLKNNQSIVGVIYRARNVASVVSDIAYMFVHLNARVQGLLQMQCLRQVHEAFIYFVFFFSDTALVKLARKKSLRCRDKSFGFRSRVFLSNLHNN